MCTMYIVQYVSLHNVIYFLGGIIYDVIVEPPSVGSTTDEHGHTRYSKERVLYQISIALDFNKWS